MNQGFGYFWNEQLCERDTGILCPEKSDRMRILSPDRIRNDLPTTQFLSFSIRDRSILELAHELEYIEFVQQANTSGKRYLDHRDTRATPDVFQQSLLSASAGCEALDAIDQGRLSRAFCAIRPPGHHANAIRAMGFCVFNNVAIAAKYAQQYHGVDKVLVIDWDLDPGNGTQEILWRDPTVFTLSFHQADLYPAAGSQDLIGGGEGEGFNRNVQLAPGTGGEEYLKTFEYVVKQVASRFAPQLVIIAAGFDAHECDPQSRLGLSEQHFAQMTRLVLDITTPYTQGRTLSLLEGGYNTAALQRSIIEHARTLATHPIPARV